ncbi:MAG: DRTGG domain-containing protein [Eubacteriales bacterium]|nr:DRTGG domain-containing protein [Eubacteriales bacterium]
MQIKEIIRLLDAKVLCGEDNLDTQIDSAFGTDMMSDALAFMHEKTLLLTGMINPHVLRTAEMLDVQCVLFVRGKTVPEELIQMGKDLDMVLLATPKTLYISSGILYAAGLPGCGTRT